MVFVRSTKHGAGTKLEFGTNDDRTVCDGELSLGISANGSADISLRSKTAEAGVNSPVSFEFSWASLFSESILHLVRFSSCSIATRKKGSLKRYYNEIEVSKLCINGKEFCLSKAFAAIWGG